MRLAVRLRAPQRPRAEEAGGSGRRRPPAGSPLAPLLQLLGRRRGVTVRELYYYPAPSALHLPSGTVEEPALPLPKPGVPNTRLFVDPAKGVAVLVDASPGHLVDEGLVRLFISRFHEALRIMSERADQRFIDILTSRDPCTATWEVENFMVQRRMIPRHLKLDEYWLALRNTSGLGPLLPLMFFDNLNNIEATVYRGRILITVEHGRYGRLRLLVPRRRPLAAGAREAMAGDDAWWNMHFTDRLLDRRAFSLIARKVAELGGVTVSAANPYAEATLTMRGRQFRASIKYTERVGNPEIVLRAFKTHPFTPVTYVVERAVYPLELVLIAYAFYKAKYIVFVTGEPGTGKTTLINVAMHLLPLHRMKLVLIQDVREFNVQHPNVSYLNTFEPQTLVEEAFIAEHISKTKKDLIRAALRLNAPAIAVNEVTHDVDVQAFLDVKGVSGGITSIHSSDVPGLFTRIKNLAAGSNLSMEEIVNNVLLVAYMSKGLAVVRQYGRNVLQQRYFMRALYLVTGISGNEIQYVPLMTRGSYNEKPNYNKEALGKYYEAVARRVYITSDILSAVFKVRGEVERLTRALEELVRLYQRDERHKLMLGRSDTFIAEWIRRLQDIEVAELLAAGPKTSVARPPAVKLPAAPRPVAKPAAAPATAAKLQARPPPPAPSPSPAQGPARGEDSIRRLRRLTGMLRRAQHNT